MSQTIATRPPRVLIIEDDEALSIAITECLGPEAEVIRAASGEEGLAYLKTIRFDGVVLDLVLSGFTSGFYIVDYLRGVNESERPVVVVESGADTERLHAVDRNVVKEIFPKPIHIDLLCRTVLEQIELRRRSLPNYQT